MVKCPKCRKEVEKLRWQAEVTHKGDFQLWDCQEGRGDEGFVVNDEQETSVPDYPVLKCPECDAVLFYDWDKAEEFLKAGGSGT